jgi:hypothetical protein
MTRTRISILLALCGVLGATALLAGPAAAGLRFQASLSGTQVVPSKGDPNGTATVTLTISPSSKLCYVIRPKRLHLLRSAQVHRGAAGTAGSTFITLFSKPKVARKGKVTGCATITARKLEELAERPNAFYVDLHTKPYPKGAARGQLSTTS